MTHETVTKESDEAERYLDDDNDDADILKGVSNLELTVSSIVETLPPNSGFSPIVTRYMLYSQSKNRTDVDMDILALKRDHKIMTFAFRSGTYDYIMTVNDYHSMLRDKLAGIHVPISPFVEELRKNCEQDVFTKRQLKHIFCWSDDIITKLVELRILSHDNCNYAFSVPSAGRFVAAIAAGRTEIIQTLKRKASRELLESELVQLSLKKSKLGAKYILFDLIGRGDVKSVRCGMGNLIKLISS